LGDDFAWVKDGVAQQLDVGEDVRLTKVWPVRLLDPVQRASLVAVLPAYF
jgi:hypothetical protein